MANSYSQIYIHIILTVKNRDSLILPSWEEKLYQYISGIVKKKNQKLLTINGIPNHIHLLISMKPSCCLSDLIREIKKSTNTFIESNGFCKQHFYWQEGSGNFSYSYSSISKVIRYIENQKEHHKKRSFKEEYLEILRKFHVDFEQEYLFRNIDEK